MKHRLSLAAVAILTLAALAAAFSSVTIDAQRNDLAFRDPVPAAPARERPKDLDQQPDPKVQMFLDMKRLVGTHAVVVGFSDEEPNAQYLEPKAWLFVTEWDGTDLYALGVPRTYNGKPLIIKSMKYGQLLYADVE